MHKFSPDGTLLKSVGEPGNAQDLKGTKDGPNLFHTPHGIWVHKDRVYVSDRENYRIQVYDLDLKFIEIWTGFARPTKIYVDAKEEVMYVSELDDRFSILNLDGSFIGRYGSRAQQRPRQVLGPALHLDRLRGLHLRRRGARRRTYAEVRAGEVG